MTDDNRPASPAEEPTPTAGQPQAGPADQGAWFAHDEAARAQAAPGSGFPVEPPARPVESGNAAPGVAPGDGTGGSAASGDGEGRSGEAAEWAAGTDTRGEMFRQQAASVGGEPAEARGPWAGQRTAGGDWSGAPSAPGGFGVPQSEWSAGSAPRPPAGSSHNEWARPQEPAGERVLYGSAAGSPPGPGAPGTNYLIRPGQPPPQRPTEERKRGSGGLVAGVAVLALLVGGGAGALGGSLVADSNSNDAPVSNALDQPPANQTSGEKPAEGTVESVAAKVSPTVVQLQVQGRQAAGEGSGFIISSDGLIVTNNHVVEVAAENGKINAVFSDGSTAAATIVGRDPTSDVAVVRAEGKSGLPTVELGSSEALKVGEGVVAIGSPFELSGTVTSGIVSSLHRPTRAGGEDGSQATVMDAIQTDAAINPGNSGGPLVNMRGQVIGINSAIYSPQSSGSSQGGSVGIGFAIPIDQARRTADEIVKTGKATQTVLGVSVRDNQDGGALIVDVTGGGAGEQAGLKSGDVVTKLDDRRIDTSDALVAAVRSHKPGDKVRLELSNGSRTVEATLAGQTVEPQ
jgi:putative serine protease PepD